MDSGDVQTPELAGPGLRDRDHRQRPERSGRADRGTLLLFSTPDRLHHVLAALTQGELSEDLHDFVATHLLHTGSGLTGNALLFGAIYLPAHGIVKVVLVVALLLYNLWAYLWMIAA